MKRCFIMLILFGVSAFAFAQGRKYYCGVICEPKASGGTNAYVDFGERKLIGLMNYKSECKPIDESKKEINFQSRAEILNWMADRGWALETTTSYNSKTIIIVYTFSKQTTKDKVKDGINLKGDHY